MIRYLTYYVSSALGPDSPSSVGVGLRFGCMQHSVSQRLLLTIVTTVKMDAIACDVRLRWCVWVEHVAINTDSFLD